MVCFGSVLVVKLIFGDWFAVCFGCLYLCVPLFLAVFFVWALLCFFCWLSCGGSRRPGIVITFAFFGGLIWCWSTCGLFSFFYSFSLHWSALISLCVVLFSVSVVSLYFFFLEFISLVVLVLPRVCFWCPCPA